jgi:hypothetical protein
MLHSTVMAFRRAALLSLLLPVIGIGCSASHGYDYDVRIDPAFLGDPDRGAMTIGAIEDWMRAVPVTLSPVFVPCSGIVDHVICLHHSTFAEVNARYPQYGGRANAVTDLDPMKDGGEVWFAIDSRFIHYPYNDAQKQATIAHEYGHAMGLHHVTGPHLMNVDLDLGTVLAPTPGDVSQWLGLR